MARFLLDTPLADFSAKTKRLHMKNLQCFRCLSRFFEDSLTVSFLKSNMLQLTYFLMSLDETCGLKNYWTQVMLTEDGKKWHNNLNIGRNDITIAQPPGSYIQRTGSGLPRGRISVLMSEKDAVDLEMSWSLLLE